jgi:hypothetical protein
VFAILLPLYKMSNEDLGHAILNPDDVAFRYSQLRHHRLFRGATEIHRSNTVLKFLVHRFARRKRPQTTSGLQNATKFSICTSCHWHNSSSTVCIRRETPDRPRQHHESRPIYIPRIRHHFTAQHLSCWRVADQTRWPLIAERQHRKQSAQKSLNIHSSGH